MRLADKISVLFVCTHNAGRSQMAEALLRMLYGDRYEVYSAGTVPGTMNPYAVKVLAELGYDLLGHRSKHIDEFMEQDLDYVVTVCDSAKEACPYFPGGKHQMHRSFPDPAALSGSDEEVLESVREIRESIKKWLVDTFGGPNGLEN
jgi:arsenate reductase